MAVAFEKLVLASGISGPGVASPPAALRQRAGNDSSLSGGEPLLHDDVPTFPPPRRPGLIATYAPQAPILLVLVAATAAGLGTARQPLNAFFILLFCSEESRVRKE